MAIPKSSKTTASRIPFDELPPWLQGTWRESGYDLMMDDGDLCREQISLDRKEYISLKLHLAELRGIPLDNTQRATLGNAADENIPVRMTLSAA